MSARLALRGVVAASSAKLVPVLVSQENCSGNYSGSVTGGLVGVGREIVVR